MPKDWKDISDDEILNFEGSQTAFMARYERIMQKRSIDAVVGLRDKVTGLMETIYRASQALQEKVRPQFQVSNAATECPYRALSCRGTLDGRIHLDNLAVSCRHAGGK